MQYSVDISHVNKIYDSEGVTFQALTDINLKIKKGAGFNGLVRKKNKKKRFKFKCL